MTDDYLRSDMGYILWQMLSCGLTVSTYKIVKVLFKKKNASKDSGRFFMIIIIYFHNYCYHYLVFVCFQLKLSSRVKNHHFSEFAIFRRLNRAYQELSFKSPVILNTRAAVEPS